VAITTTSLTAGSVNVPYSAILAATGGVPPYTWSLASGSLPAGRSPLTVNGSTIGIAYIVNPSKVLVLSTDPNPKVNSLEK